MRSVKRPMKCSCDTRQGWQRGGARGQMQKFATRKFQNFSPQGPARLPLLSGQIGEGRCAHAAVGERNYGTSANSAVCLVRNRTQAIQTIVYLLPAEDRI